MTEPHLHDDAPLAGGDLLTAISNGVTRIVAEYTGRGPTRARTIINGDWMFIALGDALTKGERKLGEIGRGDFVLKSRKVFQNAMRDDITALVETLTGRRVLAFLSDDHIDPDVGLEALMLERDGAEASDHADTRPATT